jgi:uncharacterized protein YbjT (DUF2867 family)
MKDREIAMNAPRTILVTGATGQQGGALARLLLSRGHRVRALTRKADSPAAQMLAGHGAELAVGDFDDRASLERAMQGADALFVMGTPFEAGMEAERRQATAVADVANAVGVPHLVYSSVANADRQTGIPHFESKYAVERHIRALGIPSTIIGPVFFMENFVGPQALPGLREGKIALALPAARTLQQTALADIAGFAALVLERREPFLGRRIDLASDERSGAEVAEILSRVLDRPIEYVELSLEAMGTGSEDLARMFEWFDRVGYSADIAALRREYPEVGWHTFEDWAKAQDWRALE